MVAKANKNVSTEIQFANLKKKKERAKKSKEAQRDKTFQIRVSDLELMQIRQKMSEHGFENMSDFMRTKCIAPHNLQKKDVLRLCYEVNKIGHNLNQLTRRVHVEKKIDFAVLVGIKKVQVELADLLKSSRGSNAH